MQHGLNPFRLAGDLKGKVFGEDVSQGFRYLFGTPAPSERLDLNGLTSARDGVQQAQALIRRLSARILRGHNRVWDDQLAPTPEGLVAREVHDNPYIPSGYTYLLQLVAHDLVASSASHSLNRGEAVVENTRYRPLVLDTVYGGGPDVSPHVYEFSAANRTTNGLIPRTRLRLGPQRPTLGAHCPLRDIGRATATDAEDEGRDTEMRKQWRTEALVADPRNDSHALLSQLAVLFHVLHNRLVTNLERRQANLSWQDTEVAYRRFLCARIAATLIYRNIIVMDLLERILHPEVYRRYLTDPGLPLDRNVGVPMEFAHGAFRFAHAMIRDKYLVNSERPQDTTRGLRQGTTRSPGSVPITPEWLVDWSRFFYLGVGPQPNLSRRIGPDYPLALHDEGTFPAFAAGDSSGVAFRDNLSSCFVGMRKAPELWKKFAKALPPLGFEIWQGPLRKWLGEIPGSALSEPLQQGETDRIVKDPPLPFFIQFEAAHVIDAEGKPVRRGGGRHLGHLGSCIIAETIFGAIHHHKLEPFEGEKTLKDRIAACCEKLVHDKAALATVGERDIKSMAGLIKFLQDTGDFPARE